MKQKTVEVIKQCLQAYNESEQEGVDLLNFVLETFKPFEGKKITKRMTTKLQKALEEKIDAAQSIVCYLASDLSWYSVKIRFYYGGTAKDEYDFMIRYHSSGDLYEEAEMRERSSSYGKHALARIKENEAILKSEKKLNAMAETYDNYIAAKKAYDSMPYVSGQYKIREALGLKDRY